MRNKGCVTFGSDVKICVALGRMIAYPDVAFVCGEPDFLDGKRDVIKNPTLLVEVLSKTTAAYDRGAKFDNYRTIPSLREYVLVFQDEPMIHRYLRNDDDTWTLSVVANLNQAVALPSIGIELPLAEVYDRVDFTAEVPDEQALL